MSLAGTGAISVAAEDRAAAWRGVEIAAAIANLIIACAIVGYFHDRFWWPPDDGAYAYIAGRLRNGAVLGRDLHDIHGGYIHFLNAAAMNLFGRDILSMRYPLAALTVAQSAIVFLLLRPRLGAAAIFGGVAMAALTFVQFLNPTANWYALFLAVIVAALLSGGFHRTVAGLVAIGFAVGMAFFFRQLTGVFIVMGIVAWILVDERNVTYRGRALAAKAIAATMAIGLVTYALLRVEPGAMVLYAAAPLIFLAVVAMRVRMDGPQLLRILSALAAGAVLSALPLVLYNALNGSLAAWWQDVTLSAVALTDLRFFGEANYGPLLLLAVHGVLALADPTSVLNGLFWILVFLTPAILGIAVLRAVLRGEAVPPLAVIALFFAIVSAHYAIPIYAIYGLGLALVGLLALIRAPNARTVVLAAALFASVIGIVFQAGQPLSRGTIGTIQGMRVPLDAEGIPGARVRMEAADNALYERLLHFIEDHAAPGAPILGLPMTPQLYFLSGRNPPIRFVIAPLGLLSEEDVKRSWTLLQANMPAVVVFRPVDKYTTPRVQTLMDRLRPHYKLCAIDAGFELYARDCGPDSGNEGT